MTTSRCHARDGRGQRCTDPQEGHPEVIDRNGRRALSHHTKLSWWSEPVTPLTTNVCSECRSGRHVLCLTTTLHEPCTCACAAASEWRRLLAEAAEAL